MLNHTVSRRLSLLIFTACLVLSLTLSACGSNTEAQNFNDEQGVPAIKVTEQSQLAIKASETSNTESQEKGNASQTSSELIVRFIDVGQGDCTLITCGGETLLVDGGDSSSSSKIYSVLKTLDIDYIDYIVATHTDSDHCGGLSGALQYAKCGTFYSPTAEQDTKTWNSILSRLDTQGVSITIPAPGDKFMIGTAMITVMAPIKASDDDNNNSIVIRIDHDDVSFLLTGDAETEEENDLLESNAKLDVDVLKVGHHGSSSSSGLAFLNEVTPEYAVISVGSNSYGHPTNKTLDNLQKCGAQIFRTDLDGTIIATSNGKSITFEHTKSEVLK